MMCQKSVITFSDSGGPTELVEDDVNGFIIEPTASNLADKIDLLYNNKSKATALGQEGYELARKITWEDTFDKLINI